MDANEREFIEINVKKIIGAAYEVSNQLGSGFLEKVYENALAIELRNRDIQVVTQAELPVYYKGKRVGNYYADMLVAEHVLLELKCVSKLSKEHMAQCINYLKAGNLNICLLVNFQHPKVEWQRIVYNF